MCNLHVGRQELGRREERAHVAVDMRGMNPEAQCALDLSAKLTLDLRLLCVLRDRGIFVRERSGGVEQARNLVLRLNAAPAIRLPFAREREMQSQIRIRMRPGVGSNLSDPGRRHHNARRRNGPFVERVEARRVDRVRGAEIVRVQNQQLRAGGIAQSLGDVSILRGKIRCEEKDENHGPEQRVHGKPLDRGRAGDRMMQFYPSRHSMERILADRKALASRASRSSA